MTKVYQAIASRVSAIVNCNATLDNLSSANQACERASEWITKHTEKIEEIVKNHLPSGSGFDSGTKFEFDKSNPNKLVFKADFHHMDDNGFYCGWSEHEVIITPDFVGEFKMKITGRDRRQIKDYIGDTFHHALGAELPIAQT